MNSIDTLWKKEELEQKTVQIEDELYDQLVALSENEFDASVSKIINACIYEFADRQEIRMQEVKNLSKHSVIFRKTSIKILAKLKSKFNIPQYIILNLAIKEGIEKLLKGEKNINI